jgi:hypothetical protein
MPYFFTINTTLMKKDPKLFLLLGMLILPILLRAQPGAAGAGAAAAGAGGSNVYGFRYIFLSDAKTPVQNSTIDTSATLKAAYSETGNSNEYHYNGIYYRILYRLQQAARKFTLSLFKVDRVNAVDSHYVVHANITAKSQYFTKPNSGDTTWIFTNGTKDTTYSLPHRILYNYIVPTHRLAFFLLGRSQDTLMIEVWPPNIRLQDPQYDRQMTVLEGIRNGNLYNHYEPNNRHRYEPENKRQADTFYAVLPWQNQGVGPRFQTFNVLFSTKYLIPISVPILYNFKTKSWLSSFLNAGMAYGWALGRTKFYRDGLQPSRNFYIGGGLIGGISAVTISASTVDNAALKDSLGSSTSTLPGFYYGFHIGVSFNSIQIIASGSWETAIGNNATQWSYQNHFSFGIGIGLSLFNLLVPQSASAPIGH